MANRKEEQLEETFETCKQDRAIMEEGADQMNKSSTCTKGMTELVAPHSDGAAESQETADVDNQDDFSKFFNAFVESDEKNGEKAQETAKNPPLPDWSGEALPLFNLEHFGAEMDRLKSAPNEEVDRLLIFLKKAARYGGYRRYSFSKDVSEVIENLTEDFPHFSAVLESVGDQLAYYQGTVEKKQPSVPLTPLLLLGSPGVGKSYFARALTEALGLPHVFHSIANSQTSAALAGADAVWANSKPGIVSSILAQEDTLMPVIMLDEIDKAPANSQYDPLACLHDFLEPENAKYFKDAALPGMQFDASRVLWLATANDTARLPDSLLSRFDVFEIQEPSKEVKNAIAERILQQQLANFGENLGYDAAFIHALAAFTPRKITQILRRCIGRSRKHGSKALRVTDIKENAAASGRKMGFF